MGLGKIKKTFFGLHVSNEGKLGPTVDIYGTYRSWDHIPAWAYQQPTKGVAPNFGVVAGKNMTATIDTILSEGKEIIMTLGLTPSWAALSQVGLTDSTLPSTTTGTTNPTNSRPAYNPGSNSPPQDLQYWKDYITAIGTQFKGKIKLWEIYNEVNDNQFFSGTIGGKLDKPSPGTVGYGEGSDIYNLVKSASIILKSIDPENKIISPSFTGRMQDCAVLCKDLYDGGYIDVAAFHFYTGSFDTPLSLSNTYPENLYSTNAQLVNMRKFRAALTNIGMPKNFPIWNTEFGFVMENADGTALNDLAKVQYAYKEGVEQAGVVMRGFIIAAACGIDRNCLYSWDNSTMGLVEPKSLLLNDRNKVVYKAAVPAIQTLMKWMVGKYVSPLMYDSAARIYTCYLTDDLGNKSMLCWSSTPNPVTYYFPEGAKSFTKFGLFSRIIGNGRHLLPEDAPPSTMELDTPTFNYPVNPISLTEGNPEMATKDTTYTTYTSPSTYRVITNASTEVHNNRTDYAITHEKYSGYGESTQAITAGLTSTTLMQIPLLILF